MRLRTFISGQKAFGAETLRLVIAMGHDVVGVCAPASNTAGDAPDRLRREADRSGVPVIVPEALRAGVLPPDTDVLISAHSHAYVGRPTRHACRIGAIGYHPSLLPLHRGRDAVEWTLRMGDRVAGGSVYWLSDQVDGGDVAAQDFCFVRRGDTAAELWRRELFPMGLRLFARVLQDLAGGVIVRQPQDPKLATWEPSIGRPPVFRPELPQLGALPDGFRVRRIHEAERIGA